MRKNMYSLMLSEDVVNAIDRLAAAAGTNRSGFINGILAEYVSYRTPEMRIRDMFDYMENQLKRSGDMQIMLRSSDSLFHLRSMLAYKYNPAINYNIELYRAMQNGAFGEIRVSLRTQNNTLKLYLLQFYKLWGQIETTYNPYSRIEIAGERLTKYLILPKTSSLSEDELCNRIADYITAFDRALKVFFRELDDPQSAAQSTAEIYREYFQKNRTAL